MRITFVDGSGTATLKYLASDRDRHGVLRTYFRRRGHPKVRLRAPRGSAEFLAEYRRALANALRSNAAVPRTNKATTAEGFVYFFRGGDNFIKIGFSENWRARLCGLQVSCPFMLKVAHVEQGGRKAERILHRRFAHLRLSGERFADSDGEILDFVWSRRHFFCDPQ